MCSACAMNERVGPRARFNSAHGDRWSKASSWKFVLSEAGANHSGRQGYGIVFGPASPMIARRMVEGPALGEGDMAFGPEKDSLVKTVMLPTNGQMLKVVLRR